MRKLLAFLMFYVFSLFASAQDEAAKRQILQVRSESNQAIAKGDIATFGASLASDFVMVRGNGTFSTREGYLTAFEKDFQDKASVRYERIPDRIEISTAAPLAAEHGHWIGRLSNGNTAYSGTYFAMWRRTGAEWKIRSELFVVLACGDAKSCGAYQKMTQPPAKP